MRTVLLLVTVVFVPMARAQGSNMSLANGSMTIQPGTTMVLQGQINLTLVPGSTLDNNGVIDLGTEAVLVEPAGGPVIGTGVERSELPLNAGSTELQPGGLGLTVTIPTNSGSLLVTRGHIPRIAGGQVESIGRWYGLESPSLEAVPFSVTLRYDATELNGLVPEDLSLHGSALSSGPWANMPTLNDVIGQTLTSTLDGTDIYLTAFDPDQTTTLAAIEPVGPFRVWPTATDGVVYIQALLPVDEARIEVLDASGRVVHAVQYGSFAGGPMNIDVTGLPSGCYLLRINAAHVQRFVKS